MVRVFSPFFYFIKMSNFFFAFIHFWPSHLLTSKWNLHFFLLLLLLLFVFKRMTKEKSKIRWWWWQQLEFQSHIGKETNLIRTLPFSCECARWCVYTVKATNPLCMYSSRSIITKTTVKKEGLCKLREQFRVWNISSFFFLLSLSSIFFSSFLSFSYFE